MADLVAQAVGGETAQLSAQTGTRSDGRPVGRPFSRGLSGNPKGRPRSLKAAVQQMCGDDGDRIVQEIYKIATDKRLRGHNGARVRLAAWTELRDMGFGKPQATLTLDSGATFNRLVFGGRFSENGALQAPIAAAAVEASTDA